MLYKHWERPLKELRANKKVDDSSGGKCEVEVIEIPDDDVQHGDSIEELEAKSLEDAEKGIVIFGGITVLPMMGTLLGILRMRLWMIQNLLRPSPYRPIVPNLVQRKTPSGRSI